MSSLELITGCMFSGKSSELIRRLKRFRAINKKVLVINSTKDTRSPDSVVKTHDNVTFDCVKTTRINDVIIMPEYIEADIIGIDEAQFFGNLIRFVEYSLANGKHLIVAGLDGDYRQRFFGEILCLIPMANTIDKLSAYCMECGDGTLAHFTRRTSGGGNLQELIGAEDVYKAVCRKHLMEDRAAETVTNAVITEYIKEIM